MEKYDKIIESLYAMSPSFQSVGATAYHPGMQTMHDFDNLMGQPHKNFKIIHVAGTNGKGSVSCMLASALVGMGYKVGLYTSPHLVDFRERVKILLPKGNAVMGIAPAQCISKARVVEFWEKYEDFLSSRKPSFFEITTALAFYAFAKEQVDFAVVEVGLGGRLDSTNIVNPLMSVITSIGLDHCDLLGCTEEKIAYEKAGIIKEEVPVVLGYMSGSAEVAIREVAMEKYAEVYMAKDWNDYYTNMTGFDFNKMDLLGECQKYNVRTVLTCLFELYKENLIKAGASNNFYTNKLSIVDFISLITPYIYSAAALTGLRGRWEKLSDAPLTLCDIAHNPQGIEMVMTQLKGLCEERGISWDDVNVDGAASLKMVFGVVADKDLKSIMQFLPKGAYYFWTNARGSRALPSGKLASIMSDAGFCGEEVPVVADALALAQSSAKSLDIIYIGGSSFVVAEVLENF